MPIVKMEKQAYENLCKNRNYTVEETLPCLIKADENGTIKDREGKERRAEVYYLDNEHSKFPNSHGAGAELKKMFSLVGIKSTPTCSCNQRAAHMDNKGISWCQNNKEEILGWLEEEAVKRKLPFVKFGADCVVNLAIKKAMKDPRSRP